MVDKLISLVLDIVKSERCEEDNFSLRKLKNKNPNFWAEEREKELNRVYVYLSKREKKRVWR